ncbi:MAG: FlgD immunoglobulin-like domain containing protein [Candidatus Eisenbacteria bacterium]|nr:FlgD immunoglobulin-like domain containing protein [Candidatus Eisenbacteria bacterium]
MCIRDSVGTAWQEDPTVVAGLVVGQNAAPAFGDLDGDHDLDLTVGNYSGTFNYFENTGASGIAAEEIGLGPADLRASPNPFSGRTTLTFALAEASVVDLSVFDAAGRRVRRLVLGPLGAGTHAVAWDRTGEEGAALSNGVYFCRLRAGGASRTVRVILLK